MVNRTHGRTQSLYRTQRGPLNGRETLYLALREAREAGYTLVIGMRRTRPHDAMQIDWRQIVGLFILAIPIASIARTVVFEEIFREPREWCVNRSK